MTVRRVTAIVLAGGRSSRFGRDKLAEPLGGRPMLQHAIDAVRPFATEILVVAAPGGAPAVEGDVRLVHDRAPFEGPLAGLAAGLDEAREKIVFLTAGDVPGLSTAVAELLLAALDGPGIDLAVLADGGRASPFPMAIRREPGRITSARLIGSGDRRLSSLIDALVSSVIAEPAWRAVDPDGRSIRDIDTMTDLP